MTPWHPDPVPRSRGGDNFVLAPGHCGSSVSGWRRTEQVMKGRFPLATAMAISGAAANPRGGFGGSGPTTNYAVAVAMSLLSVRLGYWLRWDAGGTIRTWLNPFGNHFVPSATSLTPWYKTGFVELTDGGHFENLGIYELIRRRCGLIIVCDGGDDRTASYAALTVAARRVKEDFGATFDFAFKVRGDRGPPARTTSSPAAYRTSIRRTPSMPNAGSSSPASATAIRSRPGCQWRRTGRSSVSSST